MLYAYLLVVEMGSSAMFYFSYYVDVGGKIDLLLFSLLFKDNNLFCT